MKTSQLKIMLGWLIGIVSACVVLLVIVLINQLSINKQLKSLDANSLQTASGSDASQLTDLQKSVDALSAKVQAPSLSSSTSLTCTGTLNQNLTGSSNSIGSFTNLSLSGTTPIDLTCNKL
jgi:aspartate-semialdehyde dehydrogenase